MNIVQTIPKRRSLTPILANIIDTDKWQRGFLIELFNSLFSRQGKFNFENLTRYSKYNELTHRRYFSKYFDCFKFNLGFVNFTKGTQKLFAVNLDRVLRVVLLLNTKTNKYVLLACTDIELDARWITKYYQLRFHSSGYRIEFIFRDAKQFMGLNDCQARNRRYCTKNKIQTNFCRKGAGKDDKPTKKIKGILNKQRSTSIEGSFGTEKEHYLLHKIKAQNLLLRIRRESTVERKNSPITKGIFITLKFI